jgi:spore coat protein JC
MVGTMVRQLLKCASTRQIKESGAAGYFVEHGRGVYPLNAGGVPLNAMSFQSKDDVIANLHEDLAAEQKARSVYENLLKMTDDPDVIEPLKFLRQREVIHFQRFGEVLDKVNCMYNQKKYY